MKKITIIQGHPDPAENRFCHALAYAYASGATDAGHEVRYINVAQLIFPLLQTYDQFYKDLTPSSLTSAQEAITWADHLVVIYPLWLGSMPALLKGFFEQTIRPRFAFILPEAGKIWKKKLLIGKSARIVITMGMPAFYYRWFFLVHGLKCQARHILGFTGVGPIRQSLVGLIGDMSVDKRQKWLDEMEELGSRGL